MWEPVCKAVLGMQNVKIWLNQAIFSTHTPSKIGVQTYAKNPKQVIHTYTLYTLLIL